MEKKRFVPLTYIKVRTDGTKYTTIIDSGANCSCVTEGLVKALGKQRKIEYKECAAKAWNGTLSQFVGTILMNINIGKERFKQQFYVAKKLGTGTQCLLGADWLRKSRTKLDFSPEGVKMYIGENQHEVQLVERTTKCIANNMIKVYDTKETKKEKREVKMAEVRTLDPYVSQAVKCTLTGKDLTEHAVVEQLDISKEIYVESQLITVRKHTPKAKAQCLQRCNSSHASNCPTQEYHYAYVMIFNASNRPVLMTEENVIGKYELMTEADKDLEVSEKRETVAKGSKEKITVRVDLKQKKKIEKGAEGLSKDVKRTKDKKVKVIKPKKKEEKGLKRLSKGLKVEKREPAVKKVTPSKLKRKETTPVTCLKTSSRKKENEILLNFLNLDPVESEYEYYKEYHRRHRPRLPLAERKIRVREMLEKEGGTHDIAKKLLLKYPEVVHIEGVPFVGTPTVKHRIIYDGPIFYQKQYKIPHILQERIEEEIEKLLHEELIEVAESQYSNAFLPVTKKDEKTGTYKVRVVLDLRRLNDYIQIDRLPIEDTQNLLNRLHGAKYLTVLDASKGYLQIALTEESKKYTAFRFGNNCYQYSKMCFGLGSAPSTWIRLMNLVLSGLKQVYKYMDDVLIYSETLEDHEKTLDLVLKRFSYHGIELSLKKCQFIQSEVDYLGYRITERGIIPQEKLLQPMLKAKLPNTLAELRGLLSLFSFYRRFIPNYSKVSHPLKELTKGYPVMKGKNIAVNTNTKECKEALDTMKKLLYQKCVLKYPNFKENFIITTDASTKGLGAVLSQYDKEGNLRPLAFASKTLNDCERRYAAVELEVLAIIFALRQFRQIVLGYSIEIQTDHLPILYLFKHVDPNARLYRHQLEILEYNIKSICHITGQSNVAADYLSRWTFGADEENNPTVTYATDSELAQSVPEGYIVNKSKEFRRENNTLIAFPGDARNVRNPRTTTELEEFNEEINKMYENRKAIGESGISSLESSPELGSVVYHTKEDITYAMCVIKEVSLIDKEKTKANIRKAIKEIEELQEEEFKFKLRNDKSQVRNYNYMVCLQKLLVYCRENEPKSVQLLWPRCEFQEKRSMKTMAAMIRCFAYALSISNIKCTVVNHPETAEVTGDIIVSALQRVEAEPKNVGELLKIEKFVEEQKQDRELRKLKHKIQNKKEKYVKDYTLENGVVYKKDFDKKGRGEVLRVCVPDHLKKTFIGIFHDEEVHQGINKCMMDIKSRSYWPGMDKDVIEYIRNCETCARAKTSNNRQVQNYHLKLPPHAGHTWAIDLLGSVGESGGFKQILVVVCTYSRFTVVKPLKNGKAGEVMLKLIDLFSYLGTPRVLISDNAGSFTGKEFQEFLTKQGIIHHRITPYAPQGNSLAERSIRSVLSMLRVLCLDKPQSWHVHLPRISEAMNSGFNLVLKERPYYLFHGRDPTTKYEVFNDLEKHQDLGESFHIAQYSYNLVEEELSKVYEKRDKIAPGNLKSYTTGDIVYISRHFVSDKARKIRHPFYGPFRVMQIIGNSTVLADLTTGKKKRVSQRDMKFFKSQTISKNDNENVDKVFPEAAGAKMEEVEATPKTSDETGATSDHQPEATNENKQNKKTKPSKKTVKATKAEESNVMEKKKETPERRYNLRARKGC